MQPATTWQAEPRQICIRSLLAVSDSDVPRDPSLALVALVVFPALVTFPGYPYARITTIFACTRAKTAEIARIVRDVLFTIISNNATMFI